MVAMCAIIGAIFGFIIAIGIAIRAVWYVIAFPISCLLRKEKKLMHDFACTNAKDMYYEVLADRVHYFKEDEKRVAVMCKAMEDMRNEAAKMKAVHIARLMLDGGKLSYEDIAAYTELTIEEVEKIASEKKSA